MKAKYLSYILGPSLFFFATQLPNGIFTEPERFMIGILAWMLTWWITEVVDLAVTALLPILLLPATRVMEIGKVTQLYGHPLIFLFFGGFILALAIQKWNLHKRIALGIIRYVGHSPKRVLLGFMLATAFLSAWISNTATTVMMLPMVMSVIQLMKKAGLKHKRLDAALLIGIAWAANIGGLITLIGSPPNLVFSSFLSQNYQIEIAFTDWLYFGLPVASTLFMGAFFILSILIGKNKTSGDSIRVFFREEQKRLGKLKGPEKSVALLFTFTALLWIFRPQLLKILPLGFQFTDTSVAILSAIVLFVFPSGKKKNTLLVWSDTTKLAWGILLLFGGGLALAEGMNQSGLLHHITDFFAGGSKLSLWLFIVCMAAIGIWATEVMSNMALVAAMMPIVAAVSAATQLSFYQLALPLTLGASCAFMLPMATPPNAIVFGSGKLKVSQMVKNGLWMNFFSMIIISSICYFLAGHLISVQ